MDKTTDKVHEGIDKLVTYLGLPPPRKDVAPPGETFSEKFVRKVSTEPLVPLGALVTIGFLSAGLRSFHRGNALQAQQLMRGRVLAQGATVFIMLCGAYAGFKPGGDRPKDYEQKLAQSQQRNNP